MEKNHINPKIIFFFLTVISIICGLISLVAISYKYSVYSTAPGNTVLAYISDLLISIFLIYIAPIQNNRNRLFKPSEFWVSLIYINDIMFIFIFGIVLEIFGILLGLALRFENLLDLAFSLYDIFLDPQNYKIFVFIAAIGTILISAGLLLISFAWINVKYSKNRLVETGLYREIRHPQYIGFFLVIIGLLIQWPSIIRLILLPFSIYIYYRLAKKEEHNMMKDFGVSYIRYMIRTGMFIPRKLDLSTIHRIRKNYFLLLGILLFSTFIISGYILISENYRVGQQKFNVDVVFDNRSSFIISCASENEIPISGQVFNCDIYPTEFRYFQGEFSDLPYKFYINYSTGSMKDYLYSPSFSKI